MPIAAISVEVKLHLIEDISHHLELCLPDFPGVMLDPAGLRKDLFKFLLGDAVDAAVFIKRNGARTCCTLI